MANRHLSRSVVLQTLFEMDASRSNDFVIGDALQRNIKEFAPGLEDFSFAEKLMQSVVDKKSKIDKIIEKSAPEWPLDQISAVDRNVLRIGLYELLFSDKKEIPPKVAINEAIELAKNFGGDSSSKFVNGVLGTVYREAFPEAERIEMEKIKQEKLGGAVVYRKEGNKVMFAMVHDVFGYWTLSKGHTEEGESQKDCAIRELKEETGLDITVEEELGVNEYIASNPEKGKIKKNVTYFLASTNDTEIVLKESGGLDDARWFEMKDLADLKTYEEIRSIIAKAVKLISAKK